MKNDPLTAQSLVTNKSLGGGASKSTGALATTSGEHCDRPVVSLSC